MPVRDPRRGLRIDGSLRLESDGARIDVIGAGDDVRVELRRRGPVRWTPRLVWSMATLYLRLRRRLAPARLRVRSMPMQSVETIADD